uniref:Uncharacterized protein n=1 Tax=Arcella intermedia TaxID=1963864 RepID=A0A6B2L7U7_9EUKA|eukprot:TRINITY_DN27817_c0_g1_i1.p1 TRINITY_DN27817_c0_g1~~TRINITY_DN27817_c0_g1_i1.p1  ORF type:complete len:365 (-),score=86.41 TRINITY_DN27817_c0_g1_i1:97-1191(-)
MSCFSGKKKTPEEEAQSKKNKEIEAALKEDKKQSNHKLKLLLLGTGDAGKSTFAKQMKVIHQDGFNRQELEKFVEILRENCVTGIQKLIESCKKWDIEIPKKNKAHTDIIERVQGEDVKLNDEVADAIEALWQTDAIQQAMKRSNEIQLPGGESGTIYYVQHCRRFAKKDYLPTQDDVIRAKLRTTGIIETVFTVGTTEFTMVDVGGQRSERRKWLNCFAGIAAVIYLVALNEYDMVLEEDNKTNRMEESLKLFQKLTGAEWFQNTSFILFLNKSDLFKEKIGRKPLSEFFEDYDSFVGGLEEGAKLDDFEKGCEYIKWQYVEAFNGDRLYPFVTCAIDTENCDRVFESVRDTVITHALTQSGL